MSEFLNKLSSYNIFNYLLPGIIFSVLVSAATKYNFIQEDIIVGLFLYYFVGMVISRIGSICIEPLSLLISFVKYAPYPDFLKASKYDDKIEILSEVNNTYRTFISLFITLAGVKGYEVLTNSYPSLDNYTFSILVFILLFLFIFSYKKQTDYIVKRIESETK